MRYDTSKRHSYVLEQDLKQSIGYCLIVFEKPHCQRYRSTLYSILCIYNNNSQTISTVTIAYMYTYLSYLFILTIPTVLHLLDLDLAATKTHLIRLAKS